jgi:glycosyltransferase involved in cell wall biosynthesis
MRIALVVTGGVDPSGRARVIPALLWLIERMARRHDVHVYVLRYLDRPVSYALLGATVHDLGRPRGLFAQHAALARALVRDGPFDVVHGYWALPGGLAAAGVARRLHVPSVVTLDSGELVALADIDYGLQRRWRQRLAVRAALRLATTVTVCSRYMHDLAVRHDIAPAVIPIGVDTRLFRPGKSRAGPPWRLLHVASLNRVKDQPTLLHAYRRIRDRLPAVHLDVVGEDTLGGSVQEMARRLELDGSMTFHGAHPTDRLIELYQSAHLVVVSSRHEAASVVALEAAACRVPVVGTAVGYLADWAPDMAVAVPPANPQALGDAVVDLLNDEPRRHRMAAAARAWVSEHDADWTADQYDRLYRALARRSGP